jgi:hypothetical protein
MQEVPSWLIVVWLIVSLLFFLTNLILLAVLAYVGLKLRPALEDLSKKVGDLTVKIERVAERVEDLAGNLGETVGNVGQKAAGILGSVELVLQSASRQFERFSPLLVGAMTAMRLVKSLNEMKSGKSPLKATTTKTLEKRKATPPKRKKLFGLL